MNIHIPKSYLIYGGLAIAAGLAYWYLKSNGYWDSWFNAQGQVIPAGPMAPVPDPQPPQDSSLIPGASMGGQPTGYVN